MATIMESKITLGPELRPCWVRGRKALFHRWAANDDVILTVNHFMKSEELHRLRQELAEEMEKSTAIIPNYVEAKKVERVTGLVEFEDGHMERVTPEQICFVNTMGRLAEIVWTDSEEVQP